MLHLDDRSAKVYADMQADLEAKRVGYRVPVYRPAPSRVGTWFSQLQSSVRREASDLRCRVQAWYARVAHPQEQCC